MSTNAKPIKGLPTDDITTAGCYHIPVLLDASLDALDIRPDGIYIDATFGGGGHSREILKRLDERGHLYGVDRDLDAMAHCDIDDPRFTFVRSDFRFIPHFMDYYGVTAVDGIIADLGVSSHHLDDENRGFSFRFDASIDMRMNQSGSTTAATLIAEKSVDELTRILKDYGEVRGAYRMAERLKSAHDSDKLHSVNDLIEALKPICPPHDKKTLARVFQALRIAVNDEMGALEALLDGGSQLLREGGRMVIITYHSLEDRPVKNFIRTGNIQGERETDIYGVVKSHMKPLSSKPTTPSNDEITLNPRSRSAKLRVGIRQS